MTVTQVLFGSIKAINKGHARYLEARLIEMARTAGRVALDNGNKPPADRRRLSEADRANMELFLENLHGECAKFTVSVGARSSMQPKSRFLDSQLQRQLKASLYRL